MFYMGKVFGIENVLFYGNSFSYPILTLLYTHVSSLVLTPTAAVPIMTIKTFLPMGEKSPDIIGQGTHVTTKQAPTVLSFPPSQQFPEEISASELLPLSSTAFSLTVIIFSTVSLANKFTRVLSMQWPTAHPHQIPTTTITTINTTMITTVHTTMIITFKTTSINSIDTMTNQPPPLARLPSSLSPQQQLLQ